MMNTTFLKKLTVALVAVFFASCDKDYNTIGADIVGNENFNFTHEDEYEVKAYNQKVGPVQTNNLPINQLGILKNDIFGKTKANFVTQLSLTEVKPKFTSTVEIDSVILSVPYFSHKTKTESNGHGIYRLDSIYSSNPLSTRDNPIYDPINLKIFKNNFYLNDYNPATDLTTNQRFFSNQDSDFSPSSSNLLLNDNASVNENSAFIPNPKEIVIYKRDLTAVNFPFTDDVDTRIKPSMRLHLNKGYFQTEIIDKAKTEATASNFDNNNIFRTFFKGLYFQVQDAATGALMSMDFSKGNVTIYYTQDKVAGNTSAKEMKSMVLNMTGNSVNLLDNTDESDYNNAVTNPTGYVDGADELYLKGGQGSKAYIELFTNEVQFNDLKFDKNRVKNALINDASLTFTVKKIVGNNKPKRVYLFDADKNTPLVDYFLDFSTNTNAKLNRATHGGIIKVSEDGNTITYKIRITRFVDGILKKEWKDIPRLGLVVTESINISSYGFLRNSVLAPSLRPDVTAGLTKVFDRLPIASVMNPLGVVFYGSKLLPTDVDYDKRVKFKIYYTKPN